MKELFLWLAGATLAFALIACVSPDQVKLPDDPSDPGQVSDFQNAIKELPADDQQLVNDFISRMAAAKEAGGYSYTPGMRVHEALAKQREWAEADAIRQQKEDELKAKQEREEAAKKEAEQKMKGLMDVKLTKKKLLKADKKKMKGQRLAMTMKFENKGDKEIVSSMGKIEFRDSSGKLLKEIKTPMQDRIKPGKSTTWPGELPCNTEKEKDAALAKLPISELKVTWNPDSYEFADGTKLSK